eukprot:g13547.t1
MRPRRGSFDDAFSPMVSMPSVVDLDAAGTRMEKDLLGSKDWTWQSADLCMSEEVPKNAYYGIQTLRALECYNITGIRLRNFPEFIVAFAMVKSFGFVHFSRGMQNSTFYDSTIYQRKACANANYKLGLLDVKKKEAIVRACNELIDPRKDESCKGLEMRENFLVDMIQGGAGTSTNMNANEVIANRALELLGHEKGQYEYCSPNDDVNKGQSTNDSYPTSAKLACILMHSDLLNAIKSLSKSFFQKAEEFADVVKMGRTQLQDAVPMTLQPKGMVEATGGGLFSRTLGQEFHAYGNSVASDIDALTSAVNRFTTSNLGGTAIGTGIAADPHFSQVAVQALRSVTGFPMILADDLIEASSSVGDMIYFSGMLRRIAAKVSKICNEPW